MPANNSVHDVIVDALVDLPPVFSRRPGDLGITRTPPAIYVADFTSAVAPFWRPVGAGASNPAARSVLTIDPLGVASPGVYTTWAALYADYLLTTGAVDITVLGDVTVPSGTYTFRSGTALHSVPGQPKYLNMQNGAVFVNPESLDTGLVIRSQSNAPVISFTPGATHSLLLQLFAGLENAGSVPMIEWNTPSSAGALNIAMDTGSSLASSSGQPVVNLTSAGPNPNEAVLGIFVGNSSRVDANTIAGNANSNVTLLPIDMTASISATQPGFVPANIQPPFVTTYSGQTMQVNGSQAPQAVNNTAEVTTTNGIAVSITGPQDAPPAVSATTLVMLTAREVSTGDTRSWIFAYCLRSVGGTVFVDTPPLDLLAVQSPLAPPLPWSYAVVPSSPNPNQSEIVVTGEPGKTIHWTLRNIVGLNVAV